MRNILLLLITLALILTIALAADKVWDRALQKDDRNKCEACKNKTSVLDVKGWLCDKHMQQLIKLKTLEGDVFKPFD